MSARSSNAGLGSAGFMQLSGRNVACKLRVARSRKVAGGCGSRQLNAWPVSLL